MRKFGPLPLEHADFLDAQDAPKRKSDLERTGVRPVESVPKAVVRSDLEPR